MMPDILEKPVVFRHLLIFLIVWNRADLLLPFLFFFSFFYVSPEPPGKRVGLLNQSGDETLRLLECHSLLGLSELLSHQPVQGSNARQLPGIASGALILFFSTAVTLSLLDFPF